MSAADDTAGLSNIAATVANLVGLEKHPKWDDSLLVEWRFAQWEVRQHDFLPSLPPLSQPRACGLLDASARAAGADGYRRRLCAAQRPVRFGLASGDYCELGVAADQPQVREQVNQRIRLAWDGRDYDLNAIVTFRAAALEDAAKSPVWIDLPWKGAAARWQDSLPIANECRPA